MTNSFTTIYTIITKAAAEAGIRDNEEYKVKIIDKSNDLLQFEMETEWSVTTCYADMESTQIVGLMTEVKTVESLFEETAVTRYRTNMPVKTA